jgi:hypothetical protein
MSSCAYEDHGWHCPRDAVEGQDRCVFHLSAEQMDVAEFWKHLGSYLLALYGKAGSERTSEFAARGDAWFFRQHDEALVKHYETQVNPRDKWSFRGFVFPPMDETHNFSGLQCEGVNFMNAQFTGAANFYKTVFHGDASFMLVGFTEGANFGLARFEGETDFRLTVFVDLADFYVVFFRQNVEFSFAHFLQDASFRGTQFEKDARFVDARFHGQVVLTHSAVCGLFDLHGVVLHDRLLLQDADIEEAALILLWNLTFRHGRTALRFAEDKPDLRKSSGSKLKAVERAFRGTLVESNGQVVLRNIRQGIERVSFLRTDIHGEERYVRFNNVTWATDPRKFLWDANLVYRPPSQWPGLLADELCVALRRLFGLGPDSPLAELESPVEADVERISREIRADYEQFGSYPDAGNYYVAEMNFRRARLPRSAWLKRPAMWLYWLVSRYGESPSWAGFWLLMWLALTSWAYMLKGFAWTGGAVHRAPALDFQQLLPTMRDFALSILHTFPKLVPFWSRPVDAEQSVLWTATAAAFQTVFYMVLALFLLAIRRRFRR